MGYRGEISPEGEVEVACHGNQTFTMTPHSYCYLRKLTVDGVIVGENYDGEAIVEYTFNNVVAPHEIIADFGEAG